MRGTASGLTKVTKVTKGDKRMVYAKVGVGGGM